MSVLLLKEEPLVAVLKIIITTTNPPCVIKTFYGRWEAGGGSHVPLYAGLA